MRIHAKELGQNAIAAVSQFHGLQACEQATLLLVEQSVEKQNGGFEFIGRYLECGGISQQWNRPRGCLERSWSRACRLSAEVYRKRPATS